MAAQTAASTIRESVGSLTLHIFTFTAVTSGDTFASGLGGSVVADWADSGFVSGTTVNGTAVGVTNSNGTFTLSGMTAASPVTLLVLSKS